MIFTSQSRVPKFHPRTILASLPRKRKHFQNLRSLEQLDQGPLRCTKISGSHLVEVEGLVGLVRKSRWSLWCRLPAPGRPERNRAEGWGLHCRSAVSCAYGSMSPTISPRIGISGDLPLTPSVIFTVASENTGVRRDLYLYLAFAYTHHFTITLPPPTPISPRTTGCGYTYMKESTVYKKITTYLLMQ